MSLRIKTALRLPLSLHYPVTAVSIPSRRLVSQMTEVHLRASVLYSLFTIQAFSTQIYGRVLQSAVFKTLQCINRFAVIPYAYIGSSLISLMELSPKRS